MNTTTPSIGTWLSTGSPVIAELAALSGFDWVLLDLEHGNESEAALPNQLRGLRGSRTRGIVRVGAPHADLIARVLDWGAHGIMVPHVNSAAEAERIVQSAHYAPRGHRGLSRGVRAYEYGLNPPGDAMPVPLIMAQIETVEAVMCSAVIARTDGIDVLFVGPSDLQFDLKHHADSSAGDYLQCLRTVVSAAKAAGKAAGILVRDAADLPAHRDLGFTHIAVDSDIAILRKAYAKILTPGHQ
ncbi:MAG: aldolase/citrate lyase family protein [Planctomycetota bacterium]|nr:aldolase/citrate lyase family protein [Planctomycetota bacterium]